MGGEVSCCRTGEGDGELELPLPSVPLPGTHRNGPLFETTELKPGEAMCQTYGDAETFLTVIRPDIKTSSTFSF